MATFDYAVLLAALAGLVMVIGGIVLIYKGAIVLASTDSSSALSIEWKQDFRLNTQAPGIAFFIIGLIFSSISIYASKPTAIEPIKIEGEVTQIPELVTIRARSSTWIVQGGSNGVIKGRIHKPESITFSLSELENRTVKFDAVNLQHLVTAIVGHQENIIEVEESIQPITAPASFGAEQ